MLGFIMGYKMKEIKEKKVSLKENQKYSNGEALHMGKHLLKEGVGRQLNAPCQYP